MNDKLQEFARKSLKEGLAEMPDGWQEIFKLMYGLPATGRTSEDIQRIKGMDINVVVDAMSEDKLDWAMQQVENSIIKRRKAINQVGLKSL